MVETYRMAYPNLDNERISISCSCLYDAAVHALNWPKLMMLINNYKWRIIL